VTASAGGGGAAGTAGRGTIGAALALPLVAFVVVVGSLWVTPDANRGHVLLATLVAVVAGLSATTIGVYGGILVPGLLLLDVDPRFAAPLSLLLQVLVIPIGATSHYRLGNVKRSITLPLLVGGVVGSATGALFASAVPGDIVARMVSFVIVAVGVIVLFSLRSGYAGGSVENEEVHAARIGGIGLTAGFASGISGAGWGPIGVKLLILARIEPRHAIGSSLVGRIFMALTAVVTYALTAAAISGVRTEWELVLPLLAGSVAAMVPGAYVVSRIGRGRASAFVALLSIALALPSLIWP
jgi:hypothetical protein